MTTTDKLIAASYEYVGHGTYSHLKPVITDKGFAAGWRSYYPVMINLNGMNYSEFTTLDALIAEGIVELRTVTTTCV